MEEGSGQSCMCERVAKPRLEEYGPFAGRLASRYSMVKFTYCPTGISGKHHLTSPRVETSPDLSTRGNIT